MYNLNDNSGGFGHSGIGIGGGAGLGFSMPVAPASGGMGGFPLCLPVGGNMGGCNNGFGGDGIWAILLLALLGRGGLGNGFGGNDGGNCAIPTIISDNINGRFSAQSDQIAAGDNSILSAISQNGIVQAVRDVDSKVCETQAMIQTTSAQGRLDTANSSAVINNNISNAQFQAQLGFERTNANIAACCCETQKEILQSRYEAAINKCDVINAIHADGEATRALITQNTIQDLRDSLTAERLAASQCAQNAYLVNTLAPRPVPSTPVFANAPMFQPTISAESFCGFGDTSFRRGGGCGSGCGGF